MKRYAIAGIAAGAAMMIGGALGAVSNTVPAQPGVLAAADAEVMNPMIAGQAMLPGRNLLENISSSPDHSTLVVAMNNSGVSDALNSGALNRRRLADLFNVQPRKPAPRRIRQHSRQPAIHHRFHALNRHRAFRHIRRTDDLPAAAGRNS